MKLPPETQVGSRRLVSEERNSVSRPKLAGTDGVRLHPVKSSRINLDRRPSSEGMAEYNGPTYPMSALLLRSRTRRSDKPPRLDGIAPVCERATRKEGNGSCWSRVNAENQHNLPANKIGYIGSVARLQAVKTPVEFF